MVTKLQDLITVIKTRFPDKATLLVDTSWDHEYNLRGAGSFWYHPVPNNLEILGLDAYMTSIDYTPDCEAAMQQKFIDDVRWEYDHVLAHYSQPIWSSVRPSPARAASTGFSQCHQIVS